MGHIGRRYDTISFLSDYGHADEFVGVVHSVIRSIAPDVAVVDITHGIARHDTRAGGLALARAANYLCPGVVVAVVDPGVGTDRRPIAIEVGAGVSVLLGPDNGLLAPAVGLVGGATRAVELGNPAYRLPAGGGATFDGRDVFAPAAAHLCVGVPLTELGPEIDPATLLPGVLPISRVEAGPLEQVCASVTSVATQRSVGARDRRPCRVCVRAGGRSCGRVCVLGSSHADARARGRARGQAGGYSYSHLR